MACVIMDGKELSSKIRKRITDEVYGIKTRSNRVPGLAVILVGHNPASEIYVRNKQKACEEVGIYSKTILLNESVTEKELLNTIDELNNDDTISGILVQLPLPKHINKENVINAISSDKDVDVFKSENIGKLFEGVHTIAPCTPAGIMALLENYNIDIDGKHCVVVGRSNIVGKPISMLMMQKNATVTMCHTHTEHLEKFTKSADILIVAAGQPGLITDDMIKSGVVIIDVGINRQEGKKICGDVQINNTDLVSYMTPVPGGVGPMTITMLLENTVKLMKKANNLI